MKAKETLIERNLLQPGAGDQILNVGGFCKRCDMCEELDEASSAGVGGKAEHAGLNEARMGEKGILESGHGRGGSKAKFGFDDASANGSVRSALIEAEEMKVIGLKIEGIAEEFVGGRADRFVAAKVFVAQIEDAASLNG